MQVLEVAKVPWLVCEYHCIGPGLFMHEACQHAALLAHMTAEQVQTLVDVFDEVALMERKPFPEAHTCEVQIRIDEVVCDVLGFDPLRCEDLRNRLAREPMVSNKPYRRRTLPPRVQRQPDMIG